MIKDGEDFISNFSQLPLFYTSTVFSCDHTSGEPPFVAKCEK